jgi:hypothetical protein
MIYELGYCKGETDSSEGHRWMGDDGGVGAIGECQFGMEAELFSLEGVPYMIGRSLVP